MKLLFVGLLLASTAMAHAATTTATVTVSADLPTGVTSVPAYIMIDNKGAGIYNVTANFAKGLSQTITFTGTWPSTSAHEIGIKLNAYSAGANLHVINAAINGVTLPGKVMTKVDWDKIEFPIVPVVVATSFKMGVNLSAMEMNSGKKPGKANFDYGTIRTSELDYYAGKGIKLIRLPILWERLQPNILAATQSYALDAPYLKLITDTMTYANSKGMTVILDLHNYGNYQAIKMNNAGGATTAEFGKGWTVIAAALKNQPGLGGYDLMNEPNGFPTLAVWPALAQAGITGIRASDTATTIYVEGNAWSSASSWNSQSNMLNTLVDPSKNLIFEAHVYGDRDSSGTHFAWATEAANGVTVNTIATRVAVFGSWCKTNSVRCMVGEIGVGNDNANWNTELANGLKQMKSDGLVSVTYWAGGPWWGSSYAMSVEPLNGADRAQMPVLLSAASN